jgi:hypothetical protein
MMASKTMATAVRIPLRLRELRTDIVDSLLVDPAPGGAQVDDREHE